MAKVLVIVESPAKARSLGKFLGKKYAVKASLGHVRDLPKSELGVNVEENFLPKYITIRGKGEIIKELKNAAKKVDKVYLAPDPDREGEAIAWHLTDVLQIEKDRPCRIEFNEITRQAVQKAIKSPRPIDVNRVNSQQARRILDRLVGYSLSPLLWRKVKKGLSAGRVQSVAVRLICDREEEIQAFVPEEYWTLTAILQGKKGRSLEARLFKAGEEKVEIPDRTRLEEILKELTGAVFQVTKITRQEKTRQPAPPFTTSTLQQEAYRKLNFPARRTMSVAQQLYEGLDLGKEGPVGLVTYIRTDSTRVAESAQAEARVYIREKFGPEYVPAEPRKAASRRKIQDAHEAIRPTSVDREPEAVKKYLTPDQYRLYKLIWSRFLAAQMSPALIETTSVDIAAGKYVFRAAGSVVKFAGFMRMYTESRDDAAEGEEEGRLLPEQLREGDRLTLKNYDPKQHFTQPPPRYTDATLVKTLEEKGIGRPSTYAPIVETIQKRDYVVRENKQFVPTELGIIVVDLLKKHFPDVIDVEFTATVEQKLDLIEEGELDWMKMLAEFYYPFQEMVAKAGEEISKIELADEVTGEICPECGRRMVIKMGRYGKFLACPGFPECRFTRPLVISTGIPCPQCPGELVERRSKKGRRFYGCSRYPECDFVVFDPPSPERCPECGGLMVIKGRRDGVVRLKCKNENCGFRLEKEAGEDRSSVVGGQTSEDHLLKSQQDGGLLSAGRGY